MTKALYFFLFTIVLVTISCSTEDNIINGLDEEQTIESKLLETGLPLVSIQTQSGEDPSCEYVSAPSGSVGRSITNNDKIPGRLVIKKKNIVLYDSGNYDANISGITIRVRGNSSAYTNKKPYKIQLQKKEDLLFREDGDKFEDKSWVLIKDSEANTLKDEMSLKPYIGMKVAEIIGMEYVPQGRYVNLLLNGKYKGIYFLSENVKRNNDCRVKVKKGSGFIVEYDPYWWNEDVYFETRFTSDVFKFTMKYPDEDELNEEWKANIIQTITEAENGIFENHYQDLIDIPSFVKWIMAHDIMGTGDGAGINKYIVKEDNTSNTLLKMGPLWDFDGIMQLTDAWPYVHSNDANNFYYRRLLRYRGFVNQYKEVWNSISSTVFQQIDASLEEYARSEEAQSLMASRKLENEECEIEYKSVSDNIVFAKKFFKERHEWLDIEIEAMAGIWY